MRDDTPDPSSLAYRIAARLSASFAGGEMQSSPRRRHLAATLPDAAALPSWPTSPRDRSVDTHAE